MKIKQEENKKKLSCNRKNRECLILLQKSPTINKKRDGKNKSYKTIWLTIKFAENFFGEKKNSTIELMQN